MLKSEKVIQPITSKGRVFVGKVVSDKMDKTIVVKVTRTFKFPLLNKIVTRAKKYKVHDEREEANVGDMVEFKECRPISKTKSMVLNRVINKMGVVS
jgi:small subunit ribosomal protein S17